MHKSMSLKYEPSSEPLHISGGLLVEDGESGVVLEALDHLLELLLRYVLVPVAPLCACVSV